MQYRRFTPDMNLSELVRANYHLFRVLHRFDIRPGFGDGTASEICQAHGIDPEFFIEIVNVFNDHHYFPETRLRQFDVHAVIRYLLKTHEDYTGNLLPEIGGMVRALVDSGGGRNRGVGMVAEMYDEYRREFLHHIEQEEELVFPHALRVYEAFRTGKQPGGDADRNLRAIREFTLQHSNMEEKLDDLLSILIKYIEPPFDAHLCSRLLVGLHLFEQDIVDHGRIEDRILFAAVDGMENAMIREVRQ